MTHGQTHSTKKQSPERPTLNKVDRCIQHAEYADTEKRESFLLLNVISKRITMDMPTRGKTRELALSQRDIKATLSGAGDVDTES